MNSFQPKIGEFKAKMSTFQSNVFEKQRCILISDMKFHVISKKCRYFFLLKYMFLIKRCFLGTGLYSGCIFTYEAYKLISP